MRARPAACMHRLAERKRNGVSVCCERAPGPCERHWLFVFWLPLRVALRLLRVPDTVRAWTRARATSARSTGHSPAAMTATARSTRLPLRFRRHNAALCAVGRVALVVHSLHRILAQCRTQQRVQRSKQVHAARGCAEHCKVSTRPGLAMPARHALLESCGRRGCTTSAGASRTQMLDSP